ncbi:hypothetical protein [Novosphingobium sp. BW1]|uniref:hypothetical protein n=1 Tax=Novosphingobium sp. BW1 TaxID=2592621 RepID=UPI0011DEAE22|nr:hypothetical protein [Novosphingobium sp. BW1]TYC93280.1 hypothetical protein FMM79_01525 [Novosphingobium sp. BW1]
MPYRITARPYRPGHTALAALIALGVGCAGCSPRSEAPDTSNATDAAFDPIPAPSPDDGGYDPAGQLTPPPTGGER